MFFLTLKASAWYSHFKAKSCALNVEPGYFCCHRYPEGTAPEPAVPQTMTIGHNNVFEVDCCVEAESIGDNNVFEAKSHVGRGVTVGKGCVVGSLCSLTCPQVRDIGLTIVGYCKLGYGVFLVLQLHQSWILNFG